MENIDWRLLPEHVLVQILSLLNLKDRYNAALVCRSWSSSFNYSKLWQDLTLTFATERDERWTKFVEKFGHHIRKLTIICYQGHEINRQNACNVINQLASVSERRLEDFILKFAEENPLFYSGKEFICVLKNLFGPPKANCTFLEYFRKIDLSKLPVAFGDDLLDILVSNHAQTLKYLDIQNASLTCNISPYCLHQLVVSCTSLRTLCVHSFSFTAGILLKFTEANRKPLHRLSLLCRREEKYSRDISSENWVQVKESLPNLRVTLKFDHTCPIFRVNEILKPEIPVSVLKLRLQATVTEQIRLAASYYSGTLEVLDVTSTPSAELDNVLVSLVALCEKLKELHVWCRMSRATIERILSIRRLKKYTMAHNEPDKS